jgi:hypothetical protein
MRAAGLVLVVILVTACSSSGGTVKDAGAGGAGGGGAGASGGAGGGGAGGSGGGGAGGGHDAAADVTQAADAAADVHAGDGATDTAADAPPTLGSPCRAGELCGGPPLGCNYGISGSGTCAHCGGPGEVCCNSMGLATGDCTEGRVCMGAVDTARHCSQTPADGGPG